MCRYQWVIGGGNVGPDLTKVGEVRSERDLLEAIVYPSASLIRSYEPVVATTADGKVLNGLLRNETSDEILLVTGANQEARIPRADIEEIRPSSVSVMPAGLDSATQRPGAGRPGCVSQGLPLNPLFLSRAVGDFSCHASFISRS